MKTLEEMRIFVAEHKEIYGDIPPRRTTTEGARAIVTRIDETVRPALIKYAQLVHESQQVPEINAAKLAVYMEELEPIRWCDDWQLSAHATVLSWTMGTVIHRDKYEAPQLSRRLFMALDYTKGGVPYPYS